MKEEEKLHVDDKKDNTMDVNESWAYGVRTTGRYDKDNKKLDMLFKIKNPGDFYRLKQKVRKLCTDKSLWMTQNYSEL